MPAAQGMSNKLKIFINIVIGGYYFQSKLTSNCKIVLIAMLKQEIDFTEKSTKQIKYSKSCAKVKLSRQTRVEPSQFLMF